MQGPRLGRFANQDFNFGRVQTDEPEEHRDLEETGKAFRSRSKANVGLSERATLGDAGES